MKFTRQTSLKTVLEVTGPGMSALATAPVIGAITKGVEAYCAFLQGKGGRNVSTTLRQQLLDFKLDFLRLSLVG